MDNFSDRLLDAINTKGSPICVGLDPRLELLPNSIVKKAFQKVRKTNSAIANAFEAFNKAVIDVVFDLVPVVKPQIAFYEAYGAAGIKAFMNTVAYAHRKGLIVIEDAKRNDIGTTAAAYALGHLGCPSSRITSKSQGLGVDAITINAYLGYDGIKPFIERASEYGKGVFILVKTSNPSSREIQDLILADPFQGMTVYERVAELVDSWGEKSIGKSGFSNVGAVVGATFPSVAAQLRKLMPNAIFLLPGYGAQGAKGKDIAPCFNAAKKGAIVSSSRQITYAFRNAEGKEISGVPFTEHIRKAVIKMRKDVNSAIGAL